MNSVQFSPDGTRFLSAGQASDRKQAKARVWDVETGTEVFALDGDHACFDPTARWIATADSSAIFRSNVVCSILFVRNGFGVRKTGERLRSLEGEIGGAIQSISFNPDGTSVLASAKGTQYVWDAETGILKQRIFSSTTTGPAAYRRGRKQDRNCKPWQRKDMGGPH